ASGLVHAAKLYPAGATTNSDSGVTDIKKIYPALEAMQKTGLVLAIHGEVTHSDIDIFDREACFIDSILKQIVSDFPELRIVFEHITTQQAVEFVKASSANIVATITAHHLLYNRNDLLAGGIRPHYYCLPILKRQRHQQALLEAATSGNPKFFLGTDSAPHSQQNKESDCGCAGAYTAHAAIELYAEAFDGMNALDKLEGFASFYGADFYKLPRNAGTITLEKTSWQVPSQLPMADDQLIPLRAGQDILWRLVNK
ncbi:MAG TPA: dihydroorotase, partial [Cellvibrionales bacterium]|nr:dihydroorotase [Cellvibrionales bacterium]